MKTEAKLLANLFLITFAFLSIWSVYQRAEIEKLHNLLDRSMKVVSGQRGVINQIKIKLEQCNN